MSRCASFVVFGFLYLASVRSSVLRNDLYSLDIIHYNDFHDRFEETSVSYPVCKFNDTRCLGGFPRLYAGVKMLLKEKPNALVLNAGDTFQGTYWYTLLKWNITQKFINMLPNDAHTIGNHEFDDGVAGLAPYLAALQAPVVVANMDTSKEPSLDGLYKPHIIVERKGKRIGIIGVITPLTSYSSNSEGVIFLDPIETVKKEAAMLTNNGVDIIIVLSHCGLAVDKQMAEEVGDNIDIIVGGHSHSLLWNGTSPSNEIISGPYPVIVEANNKPGHKVLVVTASAFTKYLGNVTAYFNMDGELQSFDGSPVFLNRSIPEDQEVKALLKPFKEELDSVVNEELGFATDDLIAEPCGSRECAIGDFIGDAYLNVTKEKNISDLPHVFFILRNMIRGSIAKGVINRGTVINALPFSNQLVTLRIKGSYLLDALANTMTLSWREKPFNGPYMPQVAGMQLTLNTTKKTVVSALVKEGEEFRPLDPDRDYQLVTFDFLSRGRNSFGIIHEKGQNLTIIGPDVVVLSDYIKKKSQITPTLDNRLKILN